MGPLAAAKKVSPERSPSPPSYEQPLSGFGSGDPLTDKSTETFAAMSAIFEGYEKELLELNSAITRKAASIPTLTRGTRLQPAASPRALDGSCARPPELSYSVARGRRAEVVVLPPLPLPPGSRRPALTRRAVSQMSARPR